MRKTLRGYLSHLKCHQEKSTRTALFLVRLSSCVVSLDTLYKIPDFSGLPVRMTVILTPVTHSSECPGAGQRGAGQMLRAEICWCCEGQWLRSGSTMHLDLEGSSTTPQGGWRKEEGKGHRKSLPLHMTSTHLVRGQSLQREPSHCWSARLSSVTIFCWKMVSGL